MDEYIGNEYISDEDSLQHEGVLERSGRYPWGSGEHPFQRLGGIYGEYKKAKQKGLSDGEIAQQLDMTVGELRARNEYYVALKFNKNVAEARAMADKGKSNQDISKALNVSIGTVKNYLEASEKPRKQKIIATRDALIEALKDTGMVDVGKGTEARMGIKRTALDAAVQTLYDEGYEVYSNVHIKQGGTGNFTTAKVLCKPGVTKGYIMGHKDEISVVNAHSTDGGLTVDIRKPPVNVDIKRVGIRYDDDPISGTDKDGVIELRRGVPDLDLGNAHYAQVRIAIDDNGVKRYAKGMAVYSDDLPDGVDILVNSNKPRSGGPAKALKDQKPDPMDPFGSSFHVDDNGLYTTSTTYTDPKTGEKKQSSLNFVNDEGTWENWSKNLPSQFLGKQRPALAKQQLNIDATQREREFDEINSLTNPVLRSNLLESFASNCDSAAVHLKAAALPRQQTHVILPAKSLKETEIYAPRYEDGEEVCIVRFPHGGIFEIPRLTVNNRNREAKKMISSQARDAVCINPKTAAQLSGADFDGDTVLVLPTKYHPIETKAPYEELKKFDPHTQYATTPEEQKKIKIWKKGSTQEGTEMGKISNLITDMTIQGAKDDEIIRAVKHSMVVIDVAKHKLNYKQSYIDNRIDELKKKYQAKVDPETGKVTYGGASSLLSRSTSDVKITGRKSYGKIDPETGKYVWVEDTEKVAKRVKGKDAEGNEEWHTEYVPRERKSTQMMETDDAYTLTTGGSKKDPGTIIEGVYAEYANRMKALANKARKTSLESKPQKVDPTAKQTYAREIDHLKWQLNEAKKNAPLERKALALAEMQVRLAKQAAQASGGMSKGEESKLLDKEVKKARKVVGADRYQVNISPREWEAIQSGAVPVTTQKELFRFADQDKLKEYAMPKTPKKLSKAMLSTAQSMLDRGYTWDEVAKRFDASVSTLSSNLNE